MKQNQVPTSNGIRCPHRPEYARRRRKQTGGSLLLSKPGSIVASAEDYAVQVFGNAPAVLSASRALVATASSTLCRRYPTPRTKMATGTQEFRKSALTICSTRFTIYPRPHLGRLSPGHAGPPTAQAPPELHVSRKGMSGVLGLYSRGIWWNSQGRFRQKRRKTEHS